MLSSPCGVASDDDKAQEDLRKHEKVASVESHRGQLLVRLHEGVLDYSDLATYLVQLGYRIENFSENQLSLEAAFMTLTKGMERPEESTS